MDEKEIEYLQSLLKIPSVGARGVNAVYEEVKKQGKAYDNKTKTGFTLAKIKQWYESREKVQTHKRGTGYHSFTPALPFHPSCLQASAQKCIGAGLPGCVSAGLVAHVPRRGLGCCQFGL